MCFYDFSNISQLLNKIQLSFPIFNLILCSSLSAEGPPRKKKDHLEAPASQHLDLPPELNPKYMNA